MAFNSPIPERKPRAKTPMGVDGVVQMEKVVQIALVLPIAVLIGWLGGAWLANRFHQPWMTLAGFVLGSVAGMSSAIRMAMVFAGPTPNDRNGKGAGKGSLDDR